MRRFAVIGLGRFGGRLAANLAAARQEVIAIDKRKALVEEMRDRVTLAVAMDATDEQALRAQGVEQVDVAVVGIGNDFESTALATVTLKQMGIKTVISRAATATAGQILRKIGADDVVNPEDESADRWAVQLSNPWFHSFFELDEKHLIVELPVPKPWVDKTLSQLRLRNDHGVHAVAIKHRHETAEGTVSIKQTLRIPLPDQPLAEHDVLVLMGSEENLAKVPAEKQP